MPLEGISMSLANAPHNLIHRTTCMLGTAESGRRTDFMFDGFTLGHAIVESLTHGYKHGVSHLNPLTQRESILRIEVIGIRTDGPMVRSGGRIDGQV
jgi:hypothetical protein